MSTSPRQTYAVRVGDWLLTAMNLMADQAGALWEYCQGLGVNEANDLRFLIEGHVNHLRELVPTYVAKQLATTSHRQRVRSLVDGVRSAPEGSGGGGGGGGGAPGHPHAKRQKGLKPPSSDAHSTTQPHSSVPHNLLEPHPETPAQQLALAAQRRDYELCIKLQPFADAFEAVEAKLGAAESRKKWDLCVELNAELQAFPKTLEEFQAKQMRKALGQELIREFFKETIDFGRVKELVGKGASVKEKDWDLGTVLHRAAWNGNAEVVTVLLDAGAHKEAKAYSGDTALHCAARNGHAEAVAVLLKAGADKEAKNKYGEVALHKAADNGHAEALTGLLDAGADIEAKDNDGLRALHHAARNGQAEALAVLLYAGADKQAKTNSGRTARDLVIQYRNNWRGVVKLLDAHSM